MQELLPFINEFLDFYTTISNLIHLKRLYWVLRKREEQRLEAAQMKFLRHLLGITKLDKEKNQCIREKTEAQNTVKEIKQYQEKWLQHIEDGHK